MHCNVVYCSWWCDEVYILYLKVWCVYFTCI